MSKFIYFLFIFFFTTPSYAYLGPGMGGGAIAAILGFLGAVLLAFWAILYYPIKRALKNRKNTKASHRNDLP